MHMLLRSTPKAPDFSATAAPEWHTPESSTSPPNGAKKTFITDQTKAVRTKVGIVAETSGHWSFVPHLSTVDQHLLRPVHVDLAILPLANGDGGTSRLEKVVNVLPVDLQELAANGVGDVGPLLLRLPQQVVHTGDDARNDALFLLGYPVDGCRRRRERDRDAMQKQKGMFVRGKIFDGSTNSEKTGMENVQPVRQSIITGACACELKHKRRVASRVEQTKTV